MALACAIGGTLAVTAVPATATPVAPHAAPRATPHAAPQSQAPRSAVALAFDSAGQGFAFYRGRDGAVYLRTFSGTKPTWSAQRRLGGDIVGSPAATVAGTTIVVAARGTNNSLWLRMRRNGTWGSWTSWGGVLTASPAITGGTHGRIDAFIRGSDDALWTRTSRPGHKLTAWKRLGGKLSSAPAAITTSDGFFEVAATGADHAVWTTSTITKWAWKSYGGRTYNAPAIGYIPESNGGFLLIHGTDKALWADGIGGGNSTGWRRIGGKLSDAPTAAGTRMPADPYILVATLGTRHAVWTTKYPATDQGGWSKFTRAWIPKG